jgi:hypothetical protein
MKYGNGPLERKPISTTSGIYYSHFHTFLALYYGPFYIFLALYYGRP